MENQQQIPPTFPNPPNPPSPPSEPPIPPIPPTPLEPSMPSIPPTPPSQPIQAIQPQILTLPGIGDLLKRSWQIYKSRFWIFLGIMIIPAVISLVIRIFATVFAISMAGLLLNFRNLNFWIIIPSFFVALLIFLFISFIVAIWPQVSLLYAIKEREQKIGIKESFAKGWHRIISYWWLSVLSAFIVMGGLILLVIPGIIFAIWFSLALYILVAEDLKGMNALFRSKQLVSGKWWSVLWRILIITLIVVVFSMGIQFLGDILNYKNIGNILSSIILVLLTPLFTAYSFLIYEDLKKFKREIPFEVPKKGTKIKYILVAIVGLLLIPVILGGIVMTSLSGTREKARDAKRMADLSSIRFAAEMYYDSNNIYPSTLDDLTSYLYSAEIPADPETNLPYQYIPLENGNNFEICADFEKDLQKKANNCLNADGQWSPIGILGATVSSVPSINVISPNGGEQWVFGNTYDIKWTSNGVDTVNIELEMPSGGIGLASNIPASLGKFSWKVDTYSNLGDYYKIRISENAKGGVYKESYNNFNIIVPTTLAPGSIEVANDLIAKGYMMQIMETAESYFEEFGNYTNLANEQGIKGLEDSILNEVGRKPSFLLTNSTYCADIFLSDGKTAFCIDSTGKSGEKMGCSGRLKCVSY